MKRLIFTLIVFALMATPALAGPTFVPAGPGPLQGVLDGITWAPVAGTSSVNVATDYLPDTMDSYWNITASGGSVATIIIELAGFAPGNVFGVYDATNSAITVQIFGGAAAAGAQATLSIDALGNVYLNAVDTGTNFAGKTFGYYLDSSVYATGGFWYSDTNLNADSWDHMAAYRGLNIDTLNMPVWGLGLWTDDEYILAFEDLAMPGADNDFTDFVAMVQSVNPIPAPGAIILGSIGVGLVGWLRRRKSL